MFLNLFMMVFVGLVFVFGYTIGQLTQKIKPTPEAREVLFKEVKKTIKAREKMQKAHSITDKVIQLKANDKALSALVKRF